jgi:hypothetical protein
MRSTFAPNLLGLTLIEDVTFPKKNLTACDDILMALQKIYMTPEYKEKIKNILESHLMKGKKNTGKIGMHLWAIFVLAQLRVGLNLSYAELCNYSNNHRGLRSIMGYETSFSFDDSNNFEYQQIYDNVTLLSDEFIHEVNTLIVDYGNKEVFKKKRNRIAIKIR